MLRATTKVVPVEHLAVHFHDTYGQALSNILVALQVRICITIDTMSSSTKLSLHALHYLCFVTFCRKE